MAQWYIDAGLIVDGSCGPLTKTAAVRSLQNCLNTNYGKSLDVDGSYGPLTKDAVKTIQYCNVGTLSYIVQGLLYGHNINPDAFDGIYAKATEDAIKEFQWAELSVWMDVVVPILGIILIKVVILKDTMLIQHSIFLSVMIIIVKHLQS